MFALAVDEVQQSPDGRLLPRPVARARLYEVLERPFDAEPEPADGWRMSAEQVRAQILSEQEREREASPTEEVAG